MVLLQKLKIKDFLSFLSLMFSKVITVSWIPLHKCIFVAMIKHWMKWQIYWSTDFYIYMHIYVGKTENGMVKNYEGGERSNGPGWSASAAADRAEWKCSVEALCAMSQQADGFM